jgi:hypothetical protein
MELIVKRDLLDAPVNFFSVSDPHHEDEEYVVANLIYGPIVLSRPYAYSEQLLLRL